MNFSGKHALVTGGANGIGRCIAEHFLAAGASVTTLDVDSTAGQALAVKYPNLQFFHGDVAKQADLETLVTSLTQTVDVLVNNVCISRRGLLSGCSYDDFLYVQQIGVVAPYYLTNLLLQQDLLTQGASIVNIASTRAKQSQADTESYTAAKGGILALTHAMAVSLSGRARVNAISPGWIDTASYQHPVENTTHSLADQKQHPAGRVGKPSDIAEMVLFLSSEKAGFITGENITISGGMDKMMIYHGDGGWQLET